MGTAVTVFKTGTYFGNKSIQNGCYCVKLALNFGNKAIRTCITVYKTGTVESV